MARTVVKLMSLIGAMVSFCFLMTGCMTHSLASEFVPMNNVEHEMIRLGEMENPSNVCPHGYFKVYYVTKNDSGHERAVFQQWNCLTQNQSENLELIESLNGEVDGVSEEEDARLVSLIKNFRLNGPDDL